MRELRRKDRKILKNEAVDILNKAKYGVLSTVTEKEKPYGVPLNYCLIDHCVYFHTAIDGQKIDCFKQNKEVSFCVVGETRIISKKFTTNYKSVIASGEVEEVFELDKQLALEGLLHKYSPEFIHSGKKYIEGMKNKTRVFKISLKKITGKAYK